MASSTTTTYNNGLYTPWSSSSAVSTPAVGYATPSTSNSAAAAPTSASVASSSPAAAPVAATTSYSNNSPAVQQSSSSAHTSSQIPTTSSSISSAGVSSISSSAIPSSSSSASSSLPLLTASQDATATATSNALASTNGSSSGSSFHATYLIPLFVIIGLGIAYIVFRTIWRRRADKRKWWPNEPMDEDNEKYVYGDAMSENDNMSGQGRHNLRGWTQYDAPRGRRDEFQMPYDSQPYAGQGDTTADAEYYNEGQGGWHEHDQDYANQVPWTEDNGYGSSTSPFWVQPEFPPPSSMDGHSYGAGQGAYQQPSEQGQFRKEQMPYLGGISSSDYARIVDRDLPPVPPEEEGVATTRDGPARESQKYQHQHVPTEEPDIDYNVPTYYHAEHEEETQRSPYDDARWSHRSRAQDVDQHAGNIRSKSSTLPTVQPKSALRDKPRQANKTFTVSDSAEHSPAVSTAHEPGTSAASFILGYSEEATPTPDQDMRKEYLTHGPRMPFLPSPIPASQRGTTLMISNPDESLSRDGDAEEDGDTTAVPDNRVGRPDGFGGIVYETLPDVRHKPESTVDTKSQAPRKVTPTASVVRTKRSFASPVMDKYAFHVNTGLKQAQSRAGAKEQGATSAMPARAAAYANVNKHERGLSFEDIAADIDSTLMGVASSRDQDSSSAEEVSFSGRRATPHAVQAHHRQEGAQSGRTVSRGQTWREKNGRWSRVAEGDRQSANPPPATVASIMPLPRARVQENETKPQRGARSEVGTSSSNILFNNGDAASRGLGEVQRRSVISYSTTTGAAARQPQRSVAHARQESHISDIPDEDLMAFAGASKTPSASPFRKIGPRPMSGAAAVPPRVASPAGPRGEGRSGHRTTAGSTLPLRVGSNRSTTSSVYSQ